MRELGIGTIILVGVLGVVCCDTDDKPSVSDLDADPDADSDTDNVAGSDPLDVEDDGCDDSTYRQGEYCFPHGAEICDDQGHFCEAGKVCCSNGCAPLGGDCCGDGQYCNPGYECIGEGMCELIFQGDVALLLTCEDLYNCVKSCFGLPTEPETAGCLVECETQASFEATEKFRKYFLCNQDCYERTELYNEYLQCFNMNCAQLQYDCIGTTTPPYDPY